LEKEVPFIVKSALLPPNKGEIEEFEAWASGLPWMEKPPSFSIFFDLRCRRDSEEKSRRIQKLRLSPADGIRAISRRKKDYLDDMKQFCTKFMGPAGNRLLSCGAGLGRGCVDAYGGFQPCLLLKSPDTAYDLKKGSLKDAFSSFFPRVRQMKAKNPDYMARCAVCFLKGLCEQCPAKSWMEDGTLDTPVDYLCEMAHEQARFLGLLKSGENAWEIKGWERRITRFSGNPPCPPEKQNTQAEICEVQG
jgi:radical SAM protein with 4Fe4S-binding SPASM domain